MLLLSVIFLYNNYFNFADKSIMLILCQMIKKFDICRVYIRFLSRNLNDIVSRRRKMKDREKYVNRFCADAQSKVER